MSFEFEYEPPEKAASRRADGRGGSVMRRLPPRWAAAIVVVLVFAASTVITSRNRGSDREVGAAGPAPSISSPTDTRPSLTTTPTTPPATRLAPVESDQPAEPGPASAAAPDPPGTKVDWAELASSVVYIEAEDCPSFDPGVFSSGSGTLVLDGLHVLTNAHVVLDDDGHPCRVIDVWFTSSFEEEPTRWTTAELLGADPGLDLAVLRLSDPSGATRSVVVTDQQLDPGGVITILGYPGDGGLTMTLTQGVYSGMTRSGGRTYIKTDADISEGNSGGAAFDEAGAFIGVPTAGIQEVGLLIPAEAAARFLARAVAA